MKHPSGLILKPIYAFKVKQTTTSTTKYCNDLKTTTHTDIHSDAMQNGRNVPTINSNKTVGKLDIYLLIRRKWLSKSNSRFYLFLCFSTCARLFLSTMPTKYKLEISGIVIYSFIYGFSFLYILNVTAKIVPLLRVGEWIL